MSKIYSDKDLEILLAITPESEVNLEEDLLIDQGDGTRACLNWELRGKGYSILKERNYEISDEELLKSAQKELEQYKIKSIFPPRN